MGSKSGRKRRERERKLRRDEDKPNVPTNGPIGERAAEGALAETVPVTGSASPELDPGPLWTPPTVPPPVPETPEARLPLSSPPPAKAPVGDGAPRDLSSATGDAPAPMRAQLSDPGVSVAHGARETLDAIRRMETRVDRLTEWLGAFTAWYQNEHLVEGDRVGDEGRSRRRHLLVAAMLGIFLPLILVLVLGGHFNWF